MILSLTEEQVKEAIATYVNAKKILTNIEVKPEHVTLKIGQSHDEAWFDGVTINLVESTKHGKK